MITSSTVALARFVATFPASGMPPAVLDRCQTLLLDAAATMLIGVAQPVHRKIGVALIDASGTGVVDALGGRRLPLSAAVLLDGVAAGCFEFEHVIANAHPASSVLPALLGLAAHLDRSGTELLAAMAIGYELATRVGAASGVAVERQRGFHNPGLNGVIASAAACSRLLGLDPLRTASAMGIAGSSAAGLLAFQSSGAMTKRLHPGRAAQLGLEAALMARAGVDGPDDVLENPKGFLHAFSPSPRPELLIEGIGECWTGMAQIVKLSPVHAYAQHFVHALNQARAAGLQWDVTTVQRIAVAAGPMAASDIHGRKTPATLVDAQYSVAFSIAAAIGRDLRDPLAFDEMILADGAVRAAAARVTITRMSDDAKQLGGSITIQSTDRDLQIDADSYPGLPDHDGYTGAVEDKFARCLRALAIEDQAGPLTRAISEISEGSAATLRLALLRAGRAVGHRG